MATSARFFCPGCERKDFGSLTSIKKHFTKESHSLRCPHCQRVFTDGLAIIQHYQMSKCAPNRTPNITQQMSPPTSPSRDVQNNHPQGADKSLGHGIEITDDHGLPSLLSPVSRTGFEESSVPDALPDVEIRRPGSWTVLEPLEQSLILRYLRSKCHSQNRLHTQNYILGAGPTRNKQRPLKGSIPTYHFREIPPPDRQARGPCQAIAIDCEMVGVKQGRQALAFLSAVDFLTGETLISRYVFPSEEVVDWRSKVSGITEAIMTAAHRCGAAFTSWREARNKLWEFMDDSTILVGHSLNFDLEVLGMCHAKIVDTAVLTAEAVFCSVLSTKPLPRMWSLKSLANDLLRLEIQNSNRGHNALEDAYAAREMAIWCIRNPEELKMWAEDAQRREEERKRAKSQRHRKGRSKSNVSASQLNRGWDYDAEHEDHSDSLRWSDLAEYLGWPEGYDPWSD